jgi:hypothetical protein
MNMCTLRRICDSAALTRVEILSLLESMSTLAIQLVYSCLLWFLHDQFLCASCISSVSFVSFIFMSFSTLSCVLFVCLQSFRVSCLLLLPSYMDNSYFPNYQILYDKKTNLAKGIAFHQPCPTFPHMRDDSFTGIHLTMCAELLIAFSENRNPTKSAHRCCWRSWAIVHIAAEHGGWHHFCLICKYICGV